MILIMRLCLWTVSIFSRRLTDRFNGSRVSVLYCVKNALHFVDESLSKLLRDLSDQKFGETAEVIYNLGPSAKLQDVCCGS